MKETNTIHRFSQMNVCINHKVQNMTEFMCMKKFMLAKLMVCASVLLFINGTFFEINLRFQPRL